MKKFLIMALLVGCGHFLFAQSSWKKIDRDSFSLKFPANWVIDTADEDYDPDALFSIDAPDGENTIMFFVFNMVIDPDEMLTEQVKNYSSTILKNPTITEFSDWGKYKGKGKCLEGKLMGVFKGKIELFMYKDDHKSMLIMQLLYDSATEQTRNELKDIVASFRFKS